jgi:DNA-binding CsgD family transcriptional regulator
MPRSPAGSTTGSADAALIITDICDGIHALVGEPADQVLGRPLLALVEVADVAALLRALAHPRPHGRVRLAARLRGRDAVSRPGQLDVLPVQPVASCTFVFTTDRPVRDAGPGIAGPGGYDATEVWVGGLGPGLDADRPDEGAERLWTRLSGREAQIVRRLLGGDRVPVIARDLFLAQATVRNHLSAAYAKLGVSSQQEVIDLFRDAHHPPRS